MKAVKIPRWIRWLENPWHIAFGPVFQKEVFVSGRRISTYVIRSGVALLLFCVLILACIPLAFEVGSGQGVDRLQKSQSLASILTAVVIGFDFGILLLFTPILIAPAVMEEVRQRTLSALLTTPITAPQIIIGKLMGRGVNLFVLALIPLPVLLVLRTLGGVPGDALFIALSMIVSATLLMASLSILVSVWSRKPASAIVAAFIFFLGIQAVPPLTILICVKKWTLFAIPDEIIASLSVFPSLVLTFADKLGGGGLPWDVSRMWIMNSLYNLAISSALIACAVLALRRVMRREGTGEKAGAPVKVKPLSHRKKVRAPGDLQPQEVTQVTDFVHNARCVQCGYDVSALKPSDAKAAIGTCPECGCQLDWVGVETSRTRMVGDQPVLWREVRQPIFKRTWHWVVAILACVALLIFISVVTWGNLGDGMKFILGVALFLSLLGGAVMTTNAIGVERDSQTWDVLLTTGLSANDILWGKLAGTLRRQAIIPCLGLLMLLVFGMGVLGLTHPAELLIWLLQIGGPVCFFSASGVLLSLIFRKSTTAAIWNLSIALFLWAGLPAFVGVVCYPIEEHLIKTGTEFSDFLMLCVLWINPFFTFGTGISEGDFGSHSQWSHGPIRLLRNHTVTLAEFVIASIFVAMLYAGAAGVLMYLAKSYFNKLSGRISGGESHALPSKAAA